MSTGNTVVDVHIGDVEHVRRLLADAPVQQRDSLLRVLTVIDKRVAAGRDALARAIDFGEDPAPAVAAFSDVTALIAEVLPS
jgi:hypothetical protein